MEISAENSTEQTSTKTDYDIIVVGAGVSGLAAANALEEKGYDVLVLEGRNRTGGRIWSDKNVLGVPVDLGASWIHGPIDNPITEIARQNGIDLEPTNFDSIMLYGRNGEPLSEDKAKQVWQRYGSFLQRIESERRALESDVPLERVFNKFTNEEPGQEGIGELQNLVTVALELEFAADISELSLFHFDSSSEFDGGNVLFPGGYKQIVDALAQDLNILLDHKVDKIDYSSDKVKVYSKGSEFSSKHVIVTVSLGVLKNNAIGFVPPLPDDKLQAIDSLKMGTLDKVYLKFPEVFWDHDYDFVGYLPKNSGTFMRFLNLYPHTGEPILAAHVSGSHAVAIEAMSDDKIIHEVLGVLRNIYCHIPNPTSYKITRWCSDSFSYGSYSFMPVGSSPDFYDTMAKPVGSKLFFAGEATTKKYPSTVHGAYMSGIREAQRIHGLQDYYV